MATWPTVTDDDGSGTTGTILDQALFNSIRDYAGVAYTTVTYASGNFTGNGSMTWTVDNADESVKYVEHGKTMIVVADIRTSTVGGTPSSALRIAVPNGRTAALGTGTFAYSDNGTPGTGWWQIDGTGAYIELYKSFSTPNWAASTNATAVLGTFVFEIN